MLQCRSSPVLLISTGRPACGWALAAKQCCWGRLLCPPHLPPSLLHPRPPSKLKTRPCDTGSTNHPLPGPARRAGGRHRVLLGAAGDARVLPAAAAAVVQDLQVEQLLRVAEGRVVQRAGRGQPGAGPVLGRDVVQPAEPPVAAGTRRGGCGSARCPGWGARAHPRATPVTALASADRRFPPKFHSTGAGPSPAPWVGAEPVTPNNNIWPQPRGCCGGFLGNNPPRHVTKPCPGGRRGQDSAVPPGTPRRAALAGLCRIPAPHPQPHRAELSPGDQRTPGGWALCFPTGGTGGSLGPWIWGLIGTSHACLHHGTCASGTARGPSARPRPRPALHPPAPLSHPHAAPPVATRGHRHPRPAGGNRRGSAGCWDQPLLGPARAPPAAPAPPARRYQPPQRVFLGRAQPEPEPAAPPSPGSP